MTDPTITIRLSLDPAQRDALAPASRAAQELAAAIDALSPEPAPRWAVDPDDPRRIIHASDPEPECGKTLIECLQGMEADRLHDGGAEDFSDWHAGHAAGWDAALDHLRVILHDHNIPVSPTSDATAAPEPSAAPDADTGRGQGGNGPQNGTQPDPLDESDHPAREEPQP